MLQILLDTLLETLTDSAKTLIFLFLVYLVIEFIEHKAMDRLRRVLASERLGVISASLLGVFPQCGFSAAAANLYSERLISAGALIAVFISTSDEAIPIIAANPSQAKWLLPLIAVKLVYAIIAGFAVDLLFKALKLDHASAHHSAHTEHIHEGGEHHHCASCDSNGGILKNAVRRTVSIFIFIFVTGFAIELVIALCGEDRLASVLMTDTVAQPFLAALVGLIPSCAASVVLSELFVAGSLSFGSLTAGLCAGAGVGMLVLFRENRSAKQNLTLIGSLYVLSAALGALLQLIIN